jgi:hypothetical protein
MSLLSTSRTEPHLLVHTFMWHLPNHRYPCLLNVTVERRIVNQYIYKERYYNIILFASPIKKIHHFCLFFLIISYTKGNHGH